MKCSITMISFSDRIRQGKMDVRQFIDHCAAYGIDAVDILEYYWTDREAEIHQIPGWLADKGLAIGAFCVGNNFIVPAQQRQAQLDAVRQGIDTAVRLGARRLRIFGGGREVPAGIDKDERIGIIIDCIRTLIPYARGQGVTLVLENHGGVPVTSDEMISILDGVDAPELKVNFDIGNFLSSGGEDPLAAAEKLHTQVDFVHVKDVVASNGDYAACVTGQGVVPISACLAYLKEKGFAGYASLEYEAWSQMESIEGVRQSIRYLKDVVSNL